MMDGWMDGKRNGWMLDGWMGDGWMDGFWMNGWVDMDRQMDGGMDDGWVIAQHCECT